MIYDMFSVAGCGVVKLQQYTTNEVLEYSNDVVYYEHMLKFWYTLIMLYILHCTLYTLNKCWDST